MITRLTAQNYRCFREADVALRSFQILVGPNGSGKTTLLDIPALLGEMIERDPATALLRPQPQRKAARARTLREVLNCHKGEGFGLSVEAELPSDIRIRLESSRTEREKSAGVAPEYVRYAVSFRLFNEHELHIETEELGIFSRTRTGRERPWHKIIDRMDASTYLLIEPTDGKRRKTADELNLRATELAFSSIPRDRTAYPAANFLRELLFRQVVFFEPDPDALRQATPPGQYTIIDADGAALPWFVLKMQAESEDGNSRFAEWLAQVQTALPSVTAISAVEREDDHHAYLRVTYDGRFTVSSTGLSYGTLRILSLTALPYLPAVPSVLVIEEPENAIHPQAIDTVLESLRWIYDSQVLLTTHSPIVLAQSKIEDLIVLSPDRDGSVTITPGDKHARLQRWQKDVKQTMDLGTLFAAGVLS